MSKTSHFAVATKRPVAILMVVMAVCVFGYVSYQKLALTLMPDVSYPTVTVRTEYPGTAPQEVETQVSEKLEQQLAIIPNLKNISSISKAGQSDIILEFQWGTDMSDATQNVREKLDRVRMPRDAKRPLLLRYDPSLDPIMRIGMTGPYPLDVLRIQAEDIIQRGLEGEPGIAAVRVKGGLEEEYQVFVDEKKLVTLGLDIQQVSSRLSQNNVNLPGGRLYEGQMSYVIRTLNELQDLSEIESIVVAKKGDANITLGDIAVIQKGHKEIEVETYVNGMQSIEIEINKEADANIVNVAENVLTKLFGTEEQKAFIAGMDERMAAQVAEAKDGGKRSAIELAIIKAKQERVRKSMSRFIANQLPEGCELQVLTDQSVFIKQSIEEVKSNAVVGGLISVLVIFLFLRKLGHTAIIGITIPVSIVATFAPMQLAGVSLNIISLGGLALGVGMLVDNSIVVLESIFRCREEGDRFVEAAVRGVSEVGGAVIASTLTTIAVFFPIVFVEGVASQIFADMSMTVVFSLLASLIVSLYFIPMLASRRFEPLDSSRQVESFFNWFFITQPFGRLKESLGFSFAKIGTGTGFAKAFWVLLFVPGIIWFVFVFLIRLPFRIVGKAGGGLVLLLLLIFAFLSKLVGGLLIVIEPFLKLFDRLFNLALVSYRSLLNWALGNKVFIVGGAFLSFGASVFFILPLLGSELIPKVHQGEFNLDVKLPIGTKIEDTTKIIRRIEDAVASDERVIRTAVTVGSDNSATSGSDEGEHSGQVTVLLAPGSDQKLEEVLLEDIRYFISNIPDVNVEVSYPELFSVKAPIEIEIYGYELSAMKDAGREVFFAINEIPGIVDTHSSLQTGNPEVQIIYDRKRLSQLDLQLKPIADLVRNKIQGQIPTEFKQRDRQVDIMVRLDEDDRMGLEDLRQIVVNPRGRVPITLDTIADLRVREGPNEIRHLDQQRGMIISANVDGISLSDAMAQIEEALLLIDLPDGFDYELRGQAEEMERSLNSMYFALGLALFLVYIVMASQFESLLHPFIILFSVPLAVIGVLVVLFLGGISLNILVFIGLIMLAGIVVNNAIVLVDYINNLRRQGMEKIEAVKTSCEARFRPILMTTMTTVLGLIPLALGIGEGAEMRTPMAITVIAGLTSSTFLTLVVIPSVYLLVDFSKIDRELEDEDKENEALELAEV